MSYILKKAQVSESSSTGAYIRKMAITGVIVKYENEEIKKLRKSLVGIQKNINQMAIRVNATGRMYDDDFEYLKSEKNGICEQNIFTKRNGDMEIEYTICFFDSNYKYYISGCMMLDDLKVIANNYMKEMLNR